jgi:hypothetical protein
VILEHPGEFLRIGDEVGLLVRRQAIKGRIVGNKDGERARSTQGIDEAARDAIPLTNLLY